MAGSGIYSILAPNIDTMLIDVSDGSTGKLNPDLIIISHGHNLLTITAEADRRQFYGQLQALTETVSTIHPQAEIAVTAQNERTDSTTYKSSSAQKAALTARLAWARGFALINVYDAFLAAADPSALYADNIHPSPTGSAVWRDEVWNIFSGGIIREQPSPLLERRENLLVNSRFDSAFVGGVPPSWTLTGPATGAAEATAFETGTQAAKITATGSSAAIYLSQALTAARLARVKGRVVTLALRIDVPAAADGDVLARCSILDGVNAEVFSKDINANNNVVCRDKYVWTIVSARIDKAATSVTVRLYGSSVGNATATAIFDRAILCLGEWPSEWSDAI
jgi:hypothetical protein